MVVEAVLEESPSSSTAVAYTVPAPQTAAVRLKWPEKSACTVPDMTPEKVTTTELGCSSETDPDTQAMCPACGVPMMNPMTGAAGQSRVSSRSRQSSVRRCRVGWGLRCVRVKKANISDPPEKM